MTPYLQQKTLYGPQIHKRISPNLGIVVVIPAYNEPYLLRSLMALHKCQLPFCDVEVIVIINSSERESPAIKAANQAVAEQARAWAAKVNRPQRWFHILVHEDMPKKHAGVGLARKIGMDEAVYRLEKIRNPKGIIACFDADSKCDKNYLVALYEHFQQHPKTPACSIYFEHPLRGIEQEEEVYEAITLYELHLRYYIQAQRWAGFPMAYQTIGSSMAVRCNAYQKQGGMNRKKAGEDFYFIHKFTPLGTFTELNTTRVIPSPRPSERVPFGTGRAVGEVLKTNGSYYTYSPQSFVELRQFFQIIKGDIPLCGTRFSKERRGVIFNDLKKIPPNIRIFLEEVSFLEKVKEIHQNTKSTRSFRTRFFRWFNAFMVMKWVHFARNHFYENVEVEEAARWLLKENGEEVKGLSGKDLLLVLRKRAKK